MLYYIYDVRSRFFVGIATGFTRTSLICAAGVFIVVLAASLVEAFLLTAGLYPDISI